MDVWKIGTKENQNNKKEKIKYAAIAIVTAVSLILYLCQIFTHGAFGWNSVFQAIGLKTDPDDLPKAQVFFLNVGQGNSTLIVNQNEAVLIDAGLPGSEGIIHRKLMDTKIDKLNYVIISHAHSDHVGGLLGLMRSVSVGEIIMNDWIPESDSDADCYNKIVESARECGIPINTAQDHRKIQLSDGELVLYVPDLTVADENNRSIAVMAKFFNTKLLFMGDNGLPAERYFINGGYDLDADILEVGHHGSKTGTSAPFMSAVTPEKAIISFGYNTYGHPTSEVMSNLKWIGCEYYFTYDESGLTADIYPERYEIQTNAEKQLIER